MRIFSTLMLEGALKALGNDQVRNRHYNRIYGFTKFKLYVDKAGT